MIAGSAGNDKVLKIAGIKFVINTYMINFILGFYKQLLKWAEKYYSHGCFCIWFGPKPFVFIFKAEYIEVS